MSKKKDSVSEALDWLSHSVQCELDADDYEKILTEVLPAAVAEHKKLVDFRRRIESIVNAAENADYWYGLDRDELVILEHLQEVLREYGKA
jgi:ribosomal protein L22